MSKIVEELFSWEQREDCRLPTEMRDAVVHFHEQVGLSSLDPSVFPILKKRLHELDREQSDTKAIAQRERQRSEQRKRLEAVFPSLRGSR